MENLQLDRLDRVLETLHQLDRSWSVKLDRAISPEESCVNII